MFDTDGSKTIDSKELKNLMIMLGVEATQEEIDEIMRQVDKDNNGFIDFDEFVTLMSDKMVFLL